MCQRPPMESHSGLPYGEPARDVAGAGAAFCSTWAGGGVFVWARASGDASRPIVKSTVSRPAIPRCRESFLL